jgi:hypothetical protein
MGHGYFAMKFAMVSEYGDLMAPIRTVLGRMEGPQRN